MKVFVVAGESSGDQLAAGVMQALPDATFAGIGGPLMLNAGLSKALFDYAELSLMGLAEIVPHIPRLLRRIHETVLAIEQAQPDLVLTVDSPDFCFRVQKKLRARGKYKGKQVHYVAPTVWAWRPKRAQKIAQFLDGLICLYPCEPDYFRPHGLRSVFVGHPIASEPEMTLDRNVFRQMHGFTANQRLIGLYAGSRGGEIKRTGPALAGAARILAKHDPSITFIVPTFPRFEEDLSSMLAGLNTFFTTDPTQKFLSMRALDGALATSGTVGLELAVASVPHVMGYKMNALTYAIGRMMVTTPYGHLANILLKRLVVPECVQGRCTPENLAQAFLTLSDQSADFAAVHRMLGGGSEVSATKKAADFINDLLRSPPRN